MRKLRRSVLVRFGVAAPCWPPFRSSSPCRRSAARRKQQKTSVPVTAGKPSEFRFSIPLLKRTVRKGVTTFTVTNRGTVNHDFKILGKKTLQIAPGKVRRVLTVTFTRTGKFTYICTLPSHALSGMKGTLTVQAVAQVRLDAVFGRVGQGAQPHQRRGQQPDHAEQRSCGRDPERRAQPDPAPERAADEGSQRPDAVVDDHVGAGDA